MELLNIDEQLCFLDSLVESPTQFYASNTDSSNNTAYGYGSMDTLDANLGSSWLNAPSIAGYIHSIPSTSDQNEMFSDTESLTSCGSAIASPAIIENTEEFRYIPDPELIELSVKELNTKLKDAPKDVATIMKKRRRTLKNRGYAHSCRIKRIVEKSSLQQTKAVLESTIAHLKEQVSTVTKERDLYKTRYEAIVRHVMNVQHMTA